MIFFTLLCALAQQNRSIDRLEKNDYYRPVAETRDAEALIDSDPRTVVEKLDPIIANPKLQKHIESRARLAEATGGYGDYYMFLPYQFRGRARVNLVRKAADPEIALKLAQGAVADLEESVRRGVAPSEEFLKLAKAELEKAKAAANTTKPPDPPLVVKEDPAALLRASIAPLLASNRFKTARAAAEKDGKDVPDAERKRIAEEVDRRCKTLLNEEMFNFRRRFGRLESLSELTEISDGAFETLFSLPAPEEISVADAAYDWARSARTAFKEVHARKAGGETLLATAAAAAALEDSLWFTRTEALGYQGVLDGVRSRADKAAGLPKAERDPLEAQAVALTAAYTKEFAGKLDPKKAADLKSRADELNRILAGFPKDLAELASIDLEAPLAGAAVEADLAKLDADLRSLETRSGIAVESRRKLYSALVTVGALRALVAGKDEDAAAADVRIWSSKLAAAGGAMDEKRFGPRVEKVFAKIK
ncbi:MAG TPA: hypothetical protein VF950_26150 [Planctomycetota bacterium]